MAVLEVREKEVDWLIDRWMRSRVEHASLIARYDEADGEGWCSPKYNAEINLISYHRWIASRLHFMASRDASSAARAHAVIVDIARSSWRFISRYGWGYRELEAIASETIAQCSYLSAPRENGWWDRTFNAPA